MCCTHSEWVTIIEAGPHCSAKKSDAVQDTPFIIQKMEIRQRLLYASPARSYFCHIIIVKFMIATDKQDVLETFRKIFNKTTSTESNADIANQQQCYLPVLIRRSPYMFPLVSTKF